MDNFRLKSAGLYDTLVCPEGSGIMYQFYFQLKNRITDNIEINSGVHFMLFSVDGDKSIEPRFGFRWQFIPGKYFNAGMGLHSRIESFPVYYSRIKNIYGKPEPTE